MPDHVPPGIAILSGVVDDRVPGQAGEIARPGQATISLSAPPRPQFPKPDWRWEQAQREHERALRATPTEPDPAIHVEDVEPLPAKPAAKTKTPNLDRWKAEMLIADTGEKP